MGYFHGQLGRERERTEASYGTECVRVCVWPADMRLLALHRVIHAFIDTVLERHHHHLRLRDSDQHNSKTTQHSRSDAALIQGGGGGGSSDTSSKRLISGELVRWEKLPSAARQTES